MFISEIVLLPLKATSNVSGNQFVVPSCHPPPFPQFNPFLSPLITALAEYPLFRVESALAVAPLDARAMLVVVVRGRSNSVLVKGSPYSPFFQSGPLDVVLTEK